VNAQFPDVPEILSGFAQMFPEYPAGWFTSNVETAKIGRVATISLPYAVAKELLAIVQRTGRDQQA
jgi:hypothetical protein